MSDGPPWYAASGPPLPNPVQGPLTETSPGALLRWTQLHWEQTAKLIPGEQVAEKMQGAWASYD